MSPGPHAAVCVDNVDLGMETVEFQGKKKEQHKMKLVFETDELLEDGKPKIISKKMTASFHERATLRKDLETWLGRPLSDEEVNEGVELDDLIGTSAQVMVLHEAGTKDPGTMFAKIDRIYPAEKKLKPSGNYTRVQDRENN